MPMCEECKQKTADYEWALKYCFRCDTKHEDCECAWPVEKPRPPRTPRLSQVDKLAVTYLKAVVDHFRKHPETWVQRSTAVKADGNICSSSDRDAVGWDVRGYLNKVSTSDMYTKMDDYYTREYMESASYAKQALAQIATKDGKVWFPEHRELERYNDMLHTAEEAVQWVEEAIDAIESNRMPAWDR